METVVLILTVATVLGAVGVVCYAAAVAKAAIQSEWDRQGAEMDAAAAEKEKEWELPDGFQDDQLLPPQSLFPPRRKQTEEW